LKSEQICFLSAAELGRLIRQKEVSPVEIVDAHLQRIEALEPKLNAFITITGDKARDAARTAEKELEQGIDRGPLHGIPLGLKDAYDTQGLRTTYGCQVFDSHVPEEDSTTARRLREAGTVLLGKLNLHTLEFGPTGQNEFYGDMHNPWDVARYSGGSSGGSGAAVASGQCTIAMGSDTGGSIRIPASLCGIVGLKTTYGLLSHHGLMGLSPTMDHHGPMARTVEDCAMMLGVLAGHDPKDPWSSKRPVPDYTKALTGDIRNIRIGVVKEYFESPVDPEVSRAVREALQVFENLGAAVVEVSWPMFHYSHAISTAILLADTAGSLGGLVSRHGPKIENLVRARIESGYFVPVTKYLKAQHGRSLLNRQSYDLLEQVDILAGPTVPVAAPRIGEDKVQVGDTRLSTVPTLLQYTRAHNLTGLPAISVPCGFTATGLPIGMQLVGRAYDEETVLRVAHAYEQATPWHKKRPPV
jgi:aspartyl-tRNA(Asn)/glutamyl-tRNA(Gln) amidotransferase subunit A